MNRMPNSKRVNLVQSVFILLCALCLTPLSGQLSEIVIPSLSAQDSAMAVTRFEQAEIQLERDSFKLAYDLAIEALQFAMQSSQPETGILSFIADIYNRQDQPGEAIPYYLRVADILKTEQDTSALPDVYSRIARNYHLEGVYEKEGEYYLNALRLTSLDNTDKRADYLEKIGISLLNSGNIDSSIIHFEQLSSLLENTGQDNSHVLNHLVQAHNRSGQNEKALEYNEALFEKYRDELDYRQMSALKNNIGYNLTLIKEFDKAALAYQEAIDYGQKADIPQKDLALLMTNAGICYQNMNESKKAKPLFGMAIRALDGSGDPAEKSRLENILALIYFHELDLYNAGIFSKNSIETAIQAEDAQRLAEGYLTYSRILREGNDPIQALEYYENYLTIRDSLDFETRLKEQDLAQRKDQLEKSERDLILKLKEERVKDLQITQLKLQLDREEQEKELIKQENDMRLLEQEKLEQDLLITRQQNAAELQERENEALEQEKQITALRLDQEITKQRGQELEIQQLEDAQKMDQLELDRQTTAKKALIWISVLGILMTILILGSLVWTRKKNVILRQQKTMIEEKNKDLEQKNEEITSQRDEIEAQRDEIEAQRDLVSEQKEDIEHSNKEILKSLEYARKIQSSTLPDLESLNTVISDHFLFFRPRDIVSGDFYWTATVENSTVLTVADCTGHGVPGAFMSVLGMSLLKEIVQKEYITHPAVILRRLRKEIINALGQKGLSGEQRDGMDMALVTIHHETHKLEYAGAYNPLYLVRRKDHPKPGIEGISIISPEEQDNGYILYDIFADKMPIAHFLRMDKFSSHELDLIKGDNIYLFSDGYPDQFGGPRSKKFKYKPFKQMLLRNAHLPMEKQNQILAETFDEWKGIEPQVDDICIIGLKI